MSERKKPSIPFYNMHGHTTFSIFDGMGYPDEHADFAFGNGLEGMAFTEHGNMNSFAYAFQKSKKMKDTFFYKVAGNSIAVPVLEAIFSRLFS